MTSASRPRALRALLCVSTLVLTTAGAGAFAAGTSAPKTGSAARTPFALVQDRDVDARLAQPEDRTPSPAAATRSRRPAPAS